MPPLILFEQQESVRDKMRKGCFFIFIFLCLAIIKPSDGVSTSFVRGEGFHLWWVVSTPAAELGALLGQDGAEIGKVEVMFECPKDVYVDRYQLAEEHRFGGPLFIVSDHAIDLEKAADSTSAKPFRVSTTLTEPGCSDGSSWEVALPIHLRYQTPSSSGDAYASFQLPGPTLILTNPGKGAALIVQAQARDDGALTVEVPVGRAADGVWVMAATLVATMTGAFYLILKVIRSAHQ